MRGNREIRSRVGLEPLDPSPSSALMTLAEATVRLAAAGSPIFARLLQLLNLSIDRTVEAVESGEIDQLRREAERQELELKIAEGHARVAQELAIAQRIETAEVVEMEEYYDNSGRGHLGAQIDETQVSFGIGGSGKKVTKRVLRFTGTARKTRQPKPKMVEADPVVSDGDGGSTAEQASGEADA